MEKRWRNRLNSKRKIKPLKGKQPLADVDRQKAAFPEDRGLNHTGDSRVRVEHAAGAPLVIATIVAHMLNPYR
jgi:hypothetical protein